MSCHVMLYCYVMLRTKGNDYKTDDKNSVIIQRHVHWVVVMLSWNKGKGGLS